MYSLCLEIWSSIQIHFPPASVQTFRQAFVWDKCKRGLRFVIACRVAAEWPIGFSTRDDGLFLSPPMCSVNDQIKMHECSFLCERRDLHLLLEGKCMSLCNCRAPRPQLNCTRQWQDKDTRIGVLAQWRWLLEPPRWVWYLVSWH